MNSRSLSAGVAHPTKAVTTSAASVAGVKTLRADGTIAAGDRVVCILTGHQLKDPTATVAYHLGDAKDNRSENDRSDHHTDQLDKPIPKGLHQDAEVWR